MTRRAVVICPGRGTYNKAELGYLARHHTGADVAGFDAARAALGQETLSALDGAARFSAGVHTVGAAASPLIYACSYLDAQKLAGDIEVVAVTGNSLGWYIALAVGGALSAEAGFEVVNTMGRLMQEGGAGGQVVYPCVGADWRPDPARRAELLAVVARVNATPGQTLCLSIDLGGMLVLAGDAAGLAAFEAALPVIDGRFPMRLPHHAAFHTPLMAPVAAKGRAALPEDLFAAPRVPLIDGRGAIWWPGAVEPGALRAYTLDHQVVAPYDFARAVRVAAREFAPDLFIVTGPGGTLGGSVAQSLIGCGWAGMADKAGFHARQTAAPLLIGMGDDAQRALVTGA